MSDTAVKSTKKKSFAKVFKWIFSIIAIFVLVAGTIVASVKITEMRGQADVAQLQNILQKLSVQNARLDALEKLPNAIATVTRQLEAASYAINTINENLSNLNQEVGNKQVPTLVKQTSDVQHRLESLEEQQKTESLVLSVALMIKENALYHQSFVDEANILESLGKDNPDIKQELEIINKYKNTDIPDNAQLVAKYTQIMKDFSFSDAKKEVLDLAQDDSTPQAVKMLKNTVLGINFDKVVVLKKEKQSTQQKKLLAELSTAVHSYNFQTALDIIAANSELTAGNHNELRAWQESVINKLTFDKAISDIISKQLSALRQDVRTNNIKMPRPAQNIQPKMSDDSVEETSAISEDVVYD